VTERKWVVGIISSFDSNTGKHSIQYEDSDSSEEDLFTVKQIEFTKPPQSMLPSKTRTQREKSQKYKLCYVPSDNRTEDGSKMSRKDALNISLGLPSDQVIESDVIVSLTSCSCQFYSSWGLPCRHMLALMNFLHKQTFLSEHITPAWCRQSSDVEEQLIKDLFSKLDHKRTRATTATSTIQERRAEWLSVVRPLTDLVTESDASLKIGKDNVRELVQELKNLILSNSKSDGTGASKQATDGSGFVQNPIGAKQTTKMKKRQMGERARADAAGRKKAKNKGNK
jgi:hypothetical protein